MSEWDFVQELFQMYSSHFGENSDYMSLNIYFE